MKNRIIFILVICGFLMPGECFSRSGSHESFSKWFKDYSIAVQRLIRYSGKVARYRKEGREEKEEKYSEKYSEEQEYISQIISNGAELYLGMSDARKSKYAKSLYRLDYIIRGIDGFSGTFLPIDSVRLLRDYMTPRRWIEEFKISVISISQYDKKIEKYEDDDREESALKYKKKFIRKSSHVNNLCLIGKEMFAMLKGSEKKSFIKKYQKVLKNLNSIERYKGSYPDISREEVLKATVDGEQWLREYKRSLTKLIGYQKSLIKAFKKEKMERIEKYRVKWELQAEYMEGHRKSLDKDVLPYLTEGRKERFEREWKKLLKTTRKYWGYREVIADMDSSFDSEYSSGEWLSLFYSAVTRLRLFYNLSRRGVRRGDSEWEKLCVEYYKRAESDVSTLVGYGNDLYDALDNKREFSRKYYKSFVVLSTVKAYKGEYPKIEAISRTPGFYKQIELYETMSRSLIKNAYRAMKGSDSALENMELLTEQGRGMITSITNKLFSIKPRSSQHRKYNRFWAKEYSELVLKMLSIQDEINRKKKKYPEVYKVWMEARKIYTIDVYIEKKED